MRQLIYILIILLFPKKSNGNNGFIDFVSNQKSNPSLFDFKSVKQVFTLYENKYFLREWNSVTAGVTTGDSKNGTSLIYQQKGNSKFSKSKINFNYAKLFTPQFSAGIGVTFIYYQQAEIQNNPRQLCPSFGFKYQAKPNFTIWSSIYQDGLSSFSKSLPNTINLSGKYFFNESFKSTLSFTSSLKNEIQFGLWGKLAKTIETGVLASNSSEPLSAVIILLKGNIKIVNSYAYHTTLGITSNLGLSCKWGS